MKGYVKIKESSYLEHWEINNIYGCSISKKNGLWIVLSGWKIFLNLMKSYNEKS